MDKKLITIKKNNTRDCEEVKRKRGKKNENQKERKHQNTKKRRENNNNKQRTQ